MNQTAGSARLNAWRFPRVQKGGITHPQDGRHRQGSEEPVVVAAEDWWAVWLGGLVMAAMVAGLIGTGAGVGRWTTPPTEAFAGRLPGLVGLAA